MKTIARIFTLAFCFVNIFIALNAATYTGRNGSTNWTLDTESGILTIYGSGAMNNYHGTWNYGNSGTPSWNRYKSYIKTVVIEDGVTSIGAASFYQCTNLTSITIPPSVTTISYEAFRGCSSLEEITVGSGVCTIQARWVTDCPKLKYINVAEGNTCYTSIDGIIYNSEMTTIVKMPDNNPIETYVIPDGIKTMETDAIYSQKNVVSVTIPESMTKIDYGVFDNCSNLTTLVFKSDNPPVLGKDLNGTSLQFIYVPCDAGSSYTGANGYWNSYSNTTNGFSESPVITLNTATNNTELGQVSTTQHADCENYMAEVTAVPTEHGIFDHWEEDGAGATTESIKFPVQVNGTYNYTAVFTPKQYTISAVQGTKTVNRKSVTSYYTVNGSGTYYYGDTIEISVSIQSGMGLKFSQWSDGNNENPRRVRVTGNATYSATLASGQQTVTIKSNDTNMGTVTPAASGTKYNFGTEIIATATPKSGYHFVNWSDGCTTEKDTIIIAGDATYIAYFAVNTYKITASANDAQMGSCSGYGTFTYNTQITLNAVANTGYRFVRWSDGVTNVSRNVTVTKNDDFVAVFEPIPYTITVKTNDALKGTVAGGGVYDYNATAVLNATPQEGYHFVNWTDDVDADAQREVLVVGNATYTANFAINTYTISVVSSNSLFGSVTGSGTYEYQTPVTLAAIPQTGYHFVAWTDDENADASRSITVAEDAEYVANFAVNKYVINFKNDNESLIKSIECDFMTLPSCENPSKEATAQYTYTFAGWTPAIVPATANTTYTATYSSSVNKYLVKFVDENGTVLQADSVEYGVKPEYKGETPSKTSNAQYSYSFAGWDSTIKEVVADATYTATYDSTVKQYTITFKNGDATLQSSKVAYGVLPEYNGAKPTKASTAQYDYIFDTWSPALDLVTSDITYSATFTSKVRKYAITFKNEDGTVLQSEEVAYGLVPTYSNAAPTKEADVQYTYTFAGWKDSVVAVTRDAIYTATFSKQINQYTVTFVNANNNVIKSEKVNYNVVPSCENPSMDSTAQYAFSFVGWNPEIKKVSGDITYKAVYDTTINQYEVVFKNIDGTVLQSGLIAYGTVPVYGGSTPTKATDAQYVYSFKYWDKELAEVTGNIVYTATYNTTLRKYTVSFMDEDGTLLQKIENIAYGELPEYTNAEPEKTADAQYTYTFDGWTPKITTVTTNTVYTAVYDSKVNKYLITFKDADGTVLQSESVEYGIKPEYKGKTPTRDTTAQYIYTFKGWDKTVASVTSETSYTAVYTATVRSYTVKFYDEDGITVLLEAKLAYGTTPSAPKPEKAATAQYTYMFDSWNPSIAMVVGPANYTATYKSTINKYVVKFVDEDGTTVLQSKEYEYGAMPVYLETEPEKENTAQYTYTFIGWDKTIDIVTANTVYTAVYSTKENEFTVIFKNYDGTVLQTSSLKYGTTPVYSEATPIQEKTAQYTYVFESWEPSITMVVGPATYTATYKSTINKYAVVFEDGNGTVLQKDSLAYGVLPVYNEADPEKAETAQFKYTFNGWDKTLVPVVENVVYTATYQETTKKYLVTFKNYDGTVLQSSEIEYGIIPSYDGAIPSKPSDGAKTYSFAGWDIALKEVTSDIVYTAAFSDATNKYLITFYDEDGVTVLQATEFVYLATPICPTPTKAQTAEYTYTFNGWTPEIEKVTEETSYTATYKATTNKYLITFYDEDGTTVLHSSEVEYGVKPSCDNPKKEADAEFTYSFDGWNPAIENVSEAKSYKATYAATKNKYVVTFLDEDGVSVLKSSDMEYGSLPSCENPTKVETAQYSYSFAGWTPAVAPVTGNIAYVATYDSNVKKYTVTFKNEDGTVLQSDLIEYGQVPVYSEAEPEKTATKQYTFVYDGWDKTIVAVNGNVTYTATYIATTNKYSVVFKNYDGTVLQSSMIEYDVVPTYKGTTPERISDGVNTYRFEGWNVEPVAVNSDVEYVAIFSNTASTYNIVFYDEDGETILQLKEYEYGAVPEYTGVTPTKAATVQYSYKFDNWEPALGTVKTDASYKAKYVATVNKYAIVFVDEDGTELQRSFVEYGTIPTFDGETPTKESDYENTYVFAGWNPSISEVKGAETYTATYKSSAVSYTITFRNYDGTELQKSTVEYGKIPAYTGMTPEKASTAQFSYDFTGWDKTLNPVKGDMIYTAVFAEKINTYTIVFKNYDGTILQSSQVAYGVLPSFNKEVPTKPSDGGIEYSFLGWDVEPVIVTEDAVYTATFTDVQLKYMITFYDEDGKTIIQKSEFAYGAIPTCPKPTKEADAQYSYSFNTWNPALEKVEGPQSYVAQYSTTKNKYNVKFVDEDGETLLSSDDYEYGVMPIVSIPTKPSTEQYSYTFAGWNNTVVAVTCDVVYQATYSKTVNSYVVTFVDDDNTKLKVQSYEYGKLPNCTSPTKASTNQYTYTFSGWNPEIEEVASAATYMATYTSTLKKYTILFKDEDGTILQKSDVAYGEVPVYSGEIPSKTNTPQTSYAFEGWNKTILPVDGEAVYVATYSATTNKYLVTFKNYDGTILQSLEIEYGIIPSYDGAIPSKPSDGAKTYSFAGWNKPVVSVIEEAVYVATFIDATNSYVITFKDYDGSIIQEESFVYGAVPTCPIPERLGNERYSYVFENWVPEIYAVTGAAVYTAEYSEITKTYWVTFVDEDGETILEKKQYEYGKIPGYTGKTPTKASTAQYSYSFNGWNEKLTAVTGDVTYSATYNETLNNYTIVFIDDENNIILRKDFAYGEIPTCSNPEKAADAQYTYAFESWSPEVSAVTEATTYRATYSKQLNSYTVKFCDENGTVLQETEVEYGNYPSFNGVKPQKKSTAQYTYEFSGWNKDLMRVVSDVTYTAMYSAITNEYVVTFKNYDGTILQLSQVMYGEYPSYAGEIPTREKTAGVTYTFFGWDKAMTQVVGDVTFTAQFKESANSYTIIFKDQNGTVLQEFDYAYGTVPVCLVTPAKSPTAEKTYVFDSWNPSVVAVDGDATYVATYRSTTNKYLITFIDGETILNSDEYEYGQVPVCEDPVRKATAQYTYTFVGWDSEIMPVSKSMTYVATFDKTINSYTVTFVDENNNKISSKEYEYGSIPSIEAPEKPADDQYSYLFDGWIPSVEPVVADVTYMASYSSSVNKYNITFLDDDESLIKTVEVSYGEKPTCKEPQKSATAQYSYMFAGWNKTILPATKNETYKATYTQVTNVYVVKFENEDGTVLASSQVEYGKIPSYEGTMPTKPNDVGNSYSFAGWDKELVAVTEDVTYTATYTDDTRKYFITFTDYDGSELQRVEFAYGAVPTCATPSRLADVRYTYEFSDWSPKLSKVTGEATYTAVYQEKINSYLISFVDEDGSTVLFSDMYEYGVVPSYEGVTPSKNATEQNTYTFAGWDKELVEVTKNETYTATYSSVENTYEVLFVDDDYSILKSEEYSYGDIPTCDSPSKSADVQYTYLFAGWNPEISVVSKNITYQATYSSEVNKYVVTFEDEDGSVLQQTDVAYGELPVYVGEIPTKESSESNDFTFAGWNKTIVEVDGPTKYVASYNTVAKTFNVTFKNYDGTILQSSMVEYGTVPSFDGELPARESSDSKTYTFSGWNPVVEKVTEEIVYTAEFIDETNSYSIVFKDEDGTVLQKNTLLYGAMPFCEIPAKEADDEYTYAFNAWSPKISVVTGDKEYTATYSSSKNLYTVTFKNEDGSVWSSKLYEYGVLPTCKVPSKPADAQYTYTFAGWDYTVIPVVADAVYTATYSSEKNQYKIMFLDENNTLLSSVAYDYGEMPKCQEPLKSATTQYSFVFAGWKPEIVSVTEDAIYRATYTSVPKSYTVVFESEGEILQSSKYVYGEIPSYEGVIPTKAGNEQYSYLFKGWNKTIVQVTGNANYSALYEESVNKYSVIFKNEDGSVLQSSLVSYGEIPSYEGSTPQKQDDAENKYSFYGWDKKLVEVTGDVVYIATYSDETRKFLITFKNDNGFIILSEEFPYGATPSCPTPSKAGDVQYSYVFKEWSPEVSQVTSDATYVATYYKEVPVTYTVKFIDDDGITVLSENTYNYGEMPVVPTVEKAATDQYSYTFKGWDKNVVEVVEDVEYVAVYKATVNKYKITFVDDDYSPIAVSEVAYGELPSCIEPSKIADAKYTYMFDAWSPKITPVNQNATYKATYSSVLNTYTITYINYDSTKLQVSEFPYGVLPEYTGAIPTKPADAEYSYMFDEWYKTVVPVTSDATYIALYKKEKNTYTVTFKNSDGTVIQSSEVVYGAYPSCEIIPTKPGDNEGVYSFKRWEDESGETLVAVVSDVVYTATYTMETQKYKITFYEEDGISIIQDFEFAKGATPFCPVPEKTESEQYTYMFNGWNPEITEVVDEASYVATYKAITKSYLITFVAEDEATVLLSGYYDYGVVPEFTEKIPEKEGSVRYSYEFSGWQPDVEAVTGNNIYVATYLQKTNVYDVTFKNENGVVLQLSKVGYGEIPIYKGETPEKQADETYTYEFKGWNSDIVAVTGNTVYIAQYEAYAGSYTIAVESNNSLYGTVEGSGVYAYGAIATLKATANMGYEFVSWDDQNTENPRSVNVGGNAEYKAIFQPNRYNLLITVNDDNYGYVNGVYDLYDYNTEVTVEAIANDGYIFDHWADGSKEPVRKYIIKGEVQDVAYFRPQEYQVSAVPNDVLMGTVKGVGSYSYNVMVELEAKAYDGFEFVKWEDGNTNKMRKFMVKCDTSFVAIFKTVQYVVELSVNDDSYGTVKGAGMYDAKVDTLIEAVPNYGYEFVGWSDNNMDLVRRIVVTSDTIFTAIFKPSVFEVALYSNDDNMGSVTGGGSFEFGSEIEIKALPADGYLFDSWSDGNTDTVRTYKVKGAASLVATFRPLEYEVTLSVNDSYYGSVRGGGKYSFLSEVELVADPNYGYRLVSWSNGVTEETQSIVLTSDTLIIANFAPALYEVNLSLNDENGGVVKGGGSYKYLDVAQISVEVAEGYEFVQWSDGDTSLVRNIIITKDVAYEAEFRKIEDTNLLIYTKPNYIVLKNVSEYDIYIINPIGEVTHHTAKCPFVTIEYYMHVKGVYVVKVKDPEGNVNVRKVLVR
ncbi:MAG: leucine-rich repeat protein [Bacteroidales bacterium]|nr:leucine-rich repeat protein [Bacteroidales bacterium]